MRKNSLQDAYPGLVKEWDYTRNAPLQPGDVTPGYKKKVWWIKEHHDPISGKSFTFIWEATVKSRVEGAGCPYLAPNPRVFPGFNDLATTHPELAAQWHPTANGDLHPKDVTAGSTRKVIWLLHYVDPDTGKAYDFEWEASINNRSNGAGCPYLVGQAVWPGYNDLATTNPDLAAQWHPFRNKDLKPTQVSANSHRKVWWQYPYDDPITGRHFDFAWEATIYSRVAGKDCPYLAGKKIWVGYNDLRSTHPCLSAQWHPTLNEDLRPEDVTAQSHKSVWWLFPYNDLQSGNYYEFTWKAPIYNRANGEGCPFLTGNAVWVGYNDLETFRPDLALQWHPTRNKDLRPDGVTTGCKRNVWWLLPYDDPTTGKHYDFEWQASVQDRVKGKGCPFLSVAPAVWKGFNDLSTTHPAVASEWHPTKNRRKSPDSVYKYSTKKVWWKCSRCGHEWYATVRSRAFNEIGCPACREIEKRLLH